MKILSHRGYWKVPGEQNTETAFRRSLELGFGLETDIRDCSRQLVVSHDMPIGSEMSLELLLQIFSKKGLTLALNIKADGLVGLVQSALEACDPHDWFVFDMSVPDTRSYLDARIPVFARVSEVEMQPPWIEEATGLWWDSFSGADYDIDRIAQFLVDGKRICIVSPELHNRRYQPVWNAIRPLCGYPNLMLCTDYPETATKFFSNDRP